MHSAEHFLQVDLLEVERELARLDLRHEEQVADELHEPLRVPLHDGEEPLLLPAELSGPAVQHETPGTRGWTSAGYLRLRATRAR